MNEYELQLPGGTRCREVGFLLWYLGIVGRGGTARQSRLPLPNNPRRDGFAVSPERDRQMWDRASTPMGTRCLTPRPRAATLDVSGNFTDPDGDALILHRAPTRYPGEPRHPCARRMAPVDGRPLCTRVPIGPALWPPPIGIARRTRHLPEGAALTMIAPNRRQAIQLPHSVP